MYATASFGADREGVVAVVPTARCSAVTGPARYCDCDVRGRGSCALGLVSGLSPMRASNGEGRAEPLQGEVGVAGRERLETDDAGVAHVRRGPGRSAG